MKIRVRTQSLGDINVDIPQTSRVSDLRPVIAERTGLDGATLRFIFHGRVLDDDEVLTERGVEDGTTVLMVTRRPPAAFDLPTSQTNTIESSGSRRQPVTTNLVNAEINIMRTGFLSDRPEAEALVRSAVQRFVAPFSNSLSWQVDSRENLPQQGDLTILVRLLGNETNHPSSGARARILRVTDILSRIILALQVIKEDLCRMVDDVINHRYSVSDEAFTRLDECVLRLEETLLVPRSHEIIGSSQNIASEGSGEAHIADNSQAEGASSNTSAFGEGRGASSSRNITRHSTRASYAQLLSHVIATQADFSAQISGYQAILQNSQAFCVDEYSRCVAEVFQEHTRRMFHCFGHIFHCLSDISSSFEDASLENLAPLAAEFESPFRTEAVFRIIALTGEESRISNLGQQAAQAFHSAAHQPSMQNVRMQIFGDVRMCRFPGNISGERRVPNLPRLLQNQSFVQFPAPVSNFSGPIDFSVLHRLLPSSISSQSAATASSPSSLATAMASTAAAAAAGAAAGVAAAAAAASSSTLQRAQDDSKRQGDTNATSDTSRQQTRSSNESTSNSSRRLNILRNLFTEAFNHILASRARAAARNEHGTANTVSDNATSASRASWTTAPAFERSSRNTGEPITFQALSVPISHSILNSQPQISVTPGVISQFVVETDGLEEARQVINAAMQAIGGTATIHHTSDSGSQNPRWIQIRPVAAEIFPSHLEASRRYPVMRMSNAPSTTQAWMSGPLYVNDRYLACRSNFASASSEINRTRSYQNALRKMREAALSYEKSLMENSEQRNDAELITDRWSSLRENDERSLHRALSGNVTEIGTMQNGPEQFQRVLGNILERIVHQMAMTDPDIAEDLGTIRNDFENYFNDLAREGRNDRTDDASSENLASTSQEAERSSGANVPSPSSQGSNNSALNNITSEVTVNTPNIRVSGAGEGSDARWSRELQVLHLIGDIMNAPGGATVGQFLRRQGYQYSHTGGGRFCYVWVIGLLKTGNGGAEREKAEIAVTV
uniref:Ubiquitin-like domain-containing protein n=1 Tax=Syphacia muris TaxID=451379 RepID=A0A0N5AV49_9BILA